MPEDWALRELERQAREIDRLRDDVRNPVPPYVPLQLFEEVRTNQGERIGQLERSLRTAQYIIWTAFLFPVIVGILVALFVSTLH